MIGRPINRSESTDFRRLRWSLTALAVLLLVIAVELSALIGPMVPAVLAQSPPDSGAQLQKLIEGQTQTNQLLQQILEHLRSGEIKVVLPTTDKENRGTPAPAPRPGGPVPKTQKAPPAR